MDFEPTAEQAALCARVRAYARSELADRYLARAASVDFAWEAYREIAALGVLRLEDVVQCGLAAEELAGGDVTLAQAAVIGMFTSTLIAEHASDGWRGRLLDRVRAGEAVVGFGMSEPDSGADAAGMRATAEMRDGGYVLNGVKTTITMLAHAEAAIVLVRDVAAGGVSAFLVDLSLPGVSRERTDDVCWRPLGRGTLTLRDVMVEADALMGEPGAAFRTVLAGLDYTRPLLVLNALGAARAALEETVAFVRSREAFGSPLAAFEGVSFPLAEHATYLEASRLLAYATLAGRAAGRPHTAHAAMAKFLGPWSASRVVHDCMLLRGHPAFERATGLEQRLCDVIAFEIADGPAQIQKIIIARELFGPEFVPYPRTR